MIFGGEPCATSRSRCWSAWPRRVLVDLIAAPLVVLWKEREPVYVRRRRAILAANNGTVPAFATGVIGDADLESEAVQAPAQAPPRRRSHRRPAG